MFLTKDKVKNAVLCAQRVLQQPDIFGGDPRKLAISVDAVTDYIAAHCSKTIIIREVEFEAVHLKGRKESFDDGRIFIDIRHNLSEPWKRFVALKELMHVIVDGNAEDWTPYGDIILEKLVLEGHIGVLSGNGDEAPAQSELVAEIAAIEVIYPLQLRAAEAKEVSEQTTSIATLSVKYEAPPPIVSTALNTDYLAVILGALKGDSN